MYNEEVIAKINNAEIERVNKYVDLRQKIVLTREH